MILKKYILTCSFVSLIKMFCLSHSTQCMLQLECQHFFGDNINILAVFCFKNNILNLIQKKLIVYNKVFFEGAPPVNG